MNILSIIGSPRENGNSALLVQDMLKEAGDANITTFYLNNMNIAGCQACMHCRTNSGCKLQDDMQQIYSEIKKADLVVIGFPVYMWQMSAQTKLFVDRLFAYYKFEGDAPEYKDKGVILAVCQGADADVFKPYIDITQKMFGSLGFKPCDVVLAKGTHTPGDVLNQADTLAKARQLMRQHLVR